MSEMLNALHKAGKIDGVMVTAVSEFIEQNQIHSAVVNNRDTVSIAVFNHLVLISVTLYNCICACCICLLIYIWFLHCKTQTFIC